MGRTKRKTAYRLLSTLLLLALAAALALPMGAFAAGGKNVVRVGWYESPFNSTDELGRRSGYAYEYQQRIAAYTGWTYEYVEGSWPELLQMLADGRIDLLSDVSYTEERTAHMLFSSLSMGAEEYYIFIAPGNEEIRLEDLSTFNGKTVGVNAGSVQADFFRDWAAANGVRAELVELTVSEEESRAMLRRGAIDLYVSLDNYLNVSTAVPVCKVGASDFYFAVSTDRPELLTELNAAMSRIQDEDPTYNLDLNAKYIKASDFNRFLSAEENAWLTGHGPIRVGYQDNYLAFCAADDKGELTGALKDYLAVASDCLANAHLEFETYAYPTAAAAMEAMKRGEVDCMFPANLTDYDGETQGYYMTPPLMRTDMSAIIREEARETFFKAERVTVAVNIGNTNYDMFLLDHFPDWRSIYFQDTPECLRAIADGKADCLLMSYYRFNNVAEQCRKLGLTVVSTGVEMDYCFAVNRDDTILYSILSKVAGVVPDATVNSALSYYFTEDAKSSLGDLVLQNLGLLAAALVVVAAVVAVLVLRKSRAEKKADEERRLISATENDELTGLYQRNFFYEYADRIYREQPDKPMDAVALNIEQFHAVNALNGREFGDLVLRTLGDEIHAFLKEHNGIACHGEADRFAIYCTHLEEPRALFDRLQDRLNSLPSNTGIQLRMGVMPWQAGTEPRQLIDEAHVACGMARGHFREHLVVFDESVRKREELEQRLLQDADRAAKNGELEVYYQPKYDIRVDPPRLMSAEALVRWRHPELGLIEPDDFVPLLERDGRIGAVDRFVWSEAARQAAEWKARYGAAVPISVNLSRVDVFDPLLESTLDEVLEANGLSHGDLKLEITEAACTENADRARDVLERLRSKGYEIEMDDFGAGYSSLNMLSAVPVDALKMDRAIIGDMDRESRDVRLVELILGIAKSLNVPVIAEGVETEAQLRLLREMGCALAQGFVFSRPLPAEEFEAAVLKESLKAQPPQN